MPRERVVAPRCVDDEEIGTLGQTNQLRAKLLDRLAAEHIEPRCRQIDSASRRSGNAILQIAMEGPLAVIEIEPGNLRP